jgi:hypothetical protein
VSVRTFSWAHGDGEVQALGGMLGPVRFRLPGGRLAAPFQVAPWAGENAAEALPGILRRLRGEWPCVPFGVERALAIDYPGASPIARLERHILPDPAAPAIGIRLVVHARADTVLPIGFHPTFRVPDGGIVIETAGGGMTFPAEVEPGVSRLAEGAWFDSLGRVPLRGGGHADLSRLPLPFATEELVQLTHPGGEVALACPAEGFRVWMEWDAAHFPGLAVWVSNRGRAAYPWSGRHQAVGLEPVCAAFDLGPRVSAGANPLSRAGHPTARAFRAGEVFSTALRISVTALGT